MEVNNETNVSTESTTVTTITKINLPPCILLLFAEYLGYVSPLLDWCEEWCTTSNFPEFKKRILFYDAHSTLNSMLNDFNIVTLHNFYNQFYEVAIKNWADKLKTNDAQLTINF